MTISSQPGSPPWAEMQWAAADYDPAQGMRRHLRAAALGLGGLALVMIVGLGFIPIGGAVIGSGQVGAESRVKRIAHPTGGTVAQILVANGDHVSQGQALVRLDNAVWGTERAMTSLTVSQLLAQRARLDAERLGLPQVRFSPELTGSSDPLALEAMRSETRLFAIRQNEVREQRGQLLARIAQSEKQIASMRAQIAALRKEQGLIAPEREGVKDLWDKGLVTISRLNQLERTAAEMEGQIASLDAQIAQAADRITETQQQMLSLAETRRAEAGTQFAAISNAINDQRMRHVNADEADRRSLIRAPYAGIVDKLMLTAVGDVIRPAETIMEIVPDRDRLTVEASISPSDIDQVRAGQRAQIRFTAFNSRTTPEIAGHVEFVAPERTTMPDTHQSFYEVRVRIDPGEMKRHPEIVLKPGMPADIFIRTGHRAMITYLTKPLADQMSRAFKDN